MITYAESIVLSRESVHQQWQQHVQRILVSGRLALIRLLLHVAMTCFI